MFWTQNYSGIIFTSEPACGNCSTIKTHSLKITPTIANQTAQQGICKIYSMNSHLWNNFLRQIWKQPISALEAQKPKQIYFKTWISIVSKTQSDEQFASCEAFFEGFRSKFDRCFGRFSPFWRWPESRRAHHQLFHLASSLLVRSLESCHVKMSRIAGCIHSGNGTLRKSVGCGYGLDMSAPAYVFSVVALNILQKAGSCAAWISKHMPDDHFFPSIVQLLQNQIFSSKGKLKAESRVSSPIWGFPGDFPLSCPIHRWLRKGFPVDELW